VTPPPTAAHICDTKGKPFPDAMKLARKLLLLLLIVSGAMTLLAQEPDLAPDPAKPQVATVNFDFVMPGARPEHYAITIASTGQVSYRSDAMPDHNGPFSDAYTLRFVASETTRARVFELAKALDYFQGDFEYGTGKIANLGAKTLTFEDGTRHITTRYNYSLNPRMQELTRLFQDISYTLESGRRLEYLHRYDKLGLDSELKNMEDAAKDGSLAELQVVRPILQQISSDYAVMNVARRRAERLLALSAEHSQSPRAAQR
jgi:hypothetical protein